MTPFLFLLLVTLCYTGFTALCLSMEKHQMDLHGAARAGSRRMRAWRGLGWTLLAATLLIAARADGWARGPVAWLGALTAAGLLLSLCVLPYRPRWLAAVAWALGGLTLLSALLPRLA